MRVNISLDETLLKQADVYAAEHNIGRSELIADSLEEKMRPKNSAEVAEKWSPKVLESILKASELVEKLQSMVGGATNATRGDVVKANVEVVKVVDSFDKPEPEYLWDDYNLMPVYKQGEDDQFCSVWHQKGLKQRVYPIKKFRPDGSIELEGKFCKACIEGFKKQDGHLE